MNTKAITAKIFKYFFVRGCNTILLLHSFSFLNIDFEEISCSVQNHSEIGFSNNQNVIIMVFFCEQFMNHHSHLSLSLVSGNGIPIFLPTDKPIRICSRSLGFQYNTNSLFATLFLFFIMVSNSVLFFTRNSFSYFF